MAKKKAKKKKAVKKKPTKKTVKKRKPKKVENNFHLRGMRKLDVKIVAAIRKNYKKGKGLKIAAIHKIVKSKGYDVTYASVRNVCIRFTWKHVA